MDISSWHALFNNVGDLNITFWIQGYLGYRDTGHFGHMGPLNLPREVPNMETWRGGGRQVLQGAATKYCLKVSAPPSMYLMSSVLQVLGLVYHTQTHPDQVQRCLKPMWPIPRLIKSKENLKVRGPVSGKQCPTFVMVVAVADDEKLPG